MRFSRAMIFFGAAYTALDMTLIRFALHLFGFRKYLLFKKESRRIAIIGNAEESARVAQLLKETQLNPDFLGVVAHDDDQKMKHLPSFLGTFRQLNEIIPVYKINEIIFCTGNISSQKIIDYMIELQKYHVDYKIASPESIAIIGSNSIHTAGDLYTINLNMLSKIEYRRKKTLMDVALAVLFILTFPITCFIVNQPIQFLKNCCSVLLRKKSWVGFYSYDHSQYKLPKIKQGVLNPTDLFSEKKLSKDMCERLDIHYAKDYTIYQDLNIIFRNFKKLGRATERKW
jgi:hypothetical protein